MCCDLEYYDRLLIPKNWGGGGGGGGGSSSPLLIYGDSLCGSVNMLRLVITVWGPKKIRNVINFLSNCDG